MAITSLSVLQADRVFILVSKRRQDQGQSKNLTDEVRSSREPPKKPSFKNHSHVRRWWTVRSIAVSDSVRVCVCVCVCVIVQTSVCGANLSFMSGLRRWWEDAENDTPHAVIEVLSLSILSVLFSRRVFVRLKFNCSLNVPPQLHDTAGQMGCQCCRMIKRWEVCLTLAVITSLFVCLFRLTRSFQWMLSGRALTIACFPSQFWFYASRFSFYWTNSKMFFCNLGEWPFNSLIIFTVGLQLISAVIILIFFCFFCECVFFCLI